MMDNYRREERISNVGKNTQTHISTNTDVRNDVDPKYLGNIVFLSFYVKLFNVQTSYYCCNKIIA